MHSRDAFTEALLTEEKENPDLLIIGGGDGTIHSIINHIDRATTTIAILPLGTVNNFAKSLGLKNGVETAVKAIAANQTKVLPLGSVNGHLFTNLSAVGITVNVAQNISDKTKKFLGRPAYYLQGIYEVLIHKPFMCELTIDDQPTQRFYTHQIVVANGRYHGPVRFIAGDHISSGHLTAVIFGRNKRRLAHLKSILYFVVPKWVRVQPVAMHGTHMKIVTEPSRAIEVDGEAVTNTPGRYELIEDGLTVIYRS